LSGWKESNHNRAPGQARGRATEGWPEGHPGGEGNRSGDCQGQPLWGEKSGSERVNAGSGNDRVKWHGLARIFSRAAIGQANLSLFFSNPLTSELARDFENPALSRYAGDPAESASRHIKEWL